MTSPEVTSEWDGDGRAREHRSQTTKELEMWDFKLGMLYRMICEKGGG